jgi:phosphoadenosine phosphosulfate reductase
MLQGQFSQSVSLDSATAFLPALGDVLFDENRGLVQVIIQRGNSQIKCLLFENGAFIVSGAEEHLKETAETLAKAILRGMLCTGCGACLTICDKNAIILEDQHAWVEERLCVQCGACLQGKCSVVDYYW